MIQTVTNIVSDGLIVDRSKFHEALEDEISLYIQKLKNGDGILRTNFVVKMNMIRGLKPNKANSRAQLNPNLWDSTKEVDET